MSGRHPWPPPKREADESEPSLRRRDLTRRLRFAVAGVYGVGAAMSGNELIDYVLEHGLPARAERERIQAERDARELDTTIS